MKQRKKTGHFGWALSGAAFLVLGSVACGPTPTGTGGSGPGGSSGSGPGGTGGAGRGGTSGTGGTGGSSGVGGTSGVLGDLNVLRQTCLDTINAYRATKGVAPLRRASAATESCADDGARQDATTGRVHGSAQDLKCGMGTQNTCPGWPPSRYGGAQGALKACLQSMWNEGEPPEGRQACVQQYLDGNRACFEKYGHYLNMSNPALTVLACGFFVMSNGSLWMNQNFGR